MIPGIVSVPAAEAGGYTGPNDIAAGAKLAWGFRALSAAMRGQASIRLLRYNDSAELDFSTDAVTGLLDYSAITTWLAAADNSDGMMLKFYAQSGAADALSTNQDNGKLLEAAGRLSFENLRSNTGAQSIDVTSGGITCFAVVKGKATLEDNPDNYIEMLLGGSTPSSLNYPSCALYDAEDPTNYAGGSFEKDIDGTAWNLYEFVIASGSHELRINGVVQTEQSSYDEGGALGDLLGLIMTFDGSGEVRELLLWDGLLDSGTRTSLRTNIATANGISL